MIEAVNKDLSIREQCRLIGMPRSGYYYKKRFRGYESGIMEWIDRIYMEHPFFGSRRILEQLKKEGHWVSRGRIRRYMRMMGYQAIYPKKKLSFPDKEHKIYPYLLRGVNVDHVNQVWSSDITFIPLRVGYAYLVVVMDWHSRYVLSWRLSTTLEADFCVEALKEALGQGRPEYFNTDQGAQFTSKEFIKELQAKEIRMSMDGKGRVFDNIFIERLWRTVKYEEVYIQSYANVKDCREGLRAYFEFYNHGRVHQSLGYLVPADVHFGRAAVNAC